MNLIPLLDAMTRAGLIAIEDAEYEKDGEVRRYRKVRLTRDRPRHALRCEGRFAHQPTVSPKSSRVLQIQSDRARRRKLKRHFQKPIANRKHSVACSITPDRP